MSPATQQVRAQDLLVGDLVWAIVGWTPAMGKRRWLMLNVSHERHNGSLLSVLGTFLDLSTMIVHQSEPLGTANSFEVIRRA